MVGDRVLFKNVRSTANTVGAANTGYNTIRNVVGVTSSGLEVDFPFCNCGRIFERWLGC